MAFLLFLLRYLSLGLLGSSCDPVDKEVPMKKMNITRFGVLLSSVVETIWAIGAGCVVAHLSA